MSKLPAYHVRRPRLTGRLLDAATGGRRTGVDACIAKPFDPGELLDVVHRLAAGRPGG